MVEPEIAEHGRDQRRRDVTADDAFAGIGLDAVDLAIMVRQPPPDRQQQAGDDVEGAGGELRDCGDFRLPQFAEQFPVGRLPVGFGKGVETEAQLVGRPQQAHAVLYRAVVEHQARRRQLDRRAARPRVDQQDRLRLRAGDRQRVDQAERPDAVLARDGEHMRLRARDRVRVDGAAIGDDDALRRDRLQTLVVGAGSNGALDLRRHQLLEHFEQQVLGLDAQRQQAVEPGRDRRQLVAQAALVGGQRQAGDGLEGRERAALDLALVQQHVELAQCRAGIGAFEIVLGAEQPCPAGLALAARDRAQRVEPPWRSSTGSACRPSHWRPSAGTAAAAPGWCGGCGRDPGWRCRRASRLRADSACAASGSWPRDRRGRSGRCRRRREKISTLLSSSMKLWVSARLAEPGRFSTASRSMPSRPVFLTMRRERPVTSATVSVPK